MLCVGWPRLYFKSFLPLALAVYALTATQFAISQVSTNGVKTRPASSERSVTEWLLRLHEASTRRSYTGTFVVSAGTAMASARIWHVCDGVQQVERVDTLTGTPRTTVRRNDEVVTFVPESKVALVERREALGLFPALLQTPSNQLADFYSLKQYAASERVAGFESEVLELLPRDDLRFGYRIWAEKKTGLVIKLQTLDAEQRVLEQVAFSELQLNAPVRMDALIRLMKNTRGYSVQQSSVTATTPQAQGWKLKADVPGFATTACQVRKDVVATGNNTGASAPMQWVFSDGLASVSLFVEAFDPKRHVSEMTMATGATHSLSRRLDDYWLTVVGEVPTSALRLFASQVERIR